MSDDGRGGDVFTLHLAPPDSGPPDDGLPPAPAAGDLAPPPDFFLPFQADDGDDSSTVDPDGVAPHMVANATSGTGTPARAAASMAMVTMTAIAVAALRGTWSVANYLKARREHHAAVADKARSAADKQKVASAKNAGVQSGHEFGRGATGKGGRGRSGGSGAGGGTGRGAFGQQKPAPKGGGRGGAANGSSGSGGRGAGGKGLKGPKNGTSHNGLSGSGRKGAGGKGGSGSGSTGWSGKGAKGAGGRGTARSEKDSSSGAKKRPGTLGALATGRQQRKNDEAKSGRQAQADLRKADLADRAAARKEELAEAADRRKRKAEKLKAKLKRELAGGSEKDSKKTGAKKDGAKKDDGAKAKAQKTGKDQPGEKVDLTKKPKAGDDPTPKSTPDAEKADRPKEPKADTSKGEDKKPKAPRKKKPRSWRWKPSGSRTGPRLGNRRRRRKGRSTPDPGAMPGGSGEWLRPPPGWDVSYTVEFDRPERPKPPRRPPVGITAGRKGLPAGTSCQITPTRSVPKESPIVMGTAADVGEVGGTQFADDTDLNLADLVDADEEMSEQILSGVDHMQLVASKCEGLRSGLESLYATLLAKKVPGVLASWCIRLMERAASVQDHAEALRGSLPRASEAILAARDSAVAADQLRADRVREAGHTAPAEREYHDRSGA